MAIRNTKIRRGSGKQSLSLVYLPQEIIEEILQKIAVKSLLRYRCVSQSWRSLIDSKIFIYKHLRNSQRRVIFNDCSTIDDPINNHLKTGSRVVGSCNGVLCIFKQGSFWWEGLFFLWNPTTRISIELPIFNISNELRYNLKELRCGFGWDEESDTYKVFACVHDFYDEGLGKVYSSKTNSWKTVECGRLSLCGTPDSYDPCYHVGVFARGKIHWIPKRGYNHIESFDLKSEVFETMELPLKAQNRVGRGRLLRERDGVLYVVLNKNGRVEQYVYVESLVSPI